MAEMKPVDLNDPALEDAVVEIEQTKEQVETPVRMITGAAGTGKTFSVREEISKDPKAALLCATTGIAAVNLGTITLHSALGLHPDSLEDQFTTGYMRQKMHQVARHHRSIGIDEMSMLSATLLDMLYQTAEQVNEYADVKDPFGLTLIGDFCQLPPINEPWAFEAQCWPKFEAATTRLTKNWRQGDGRFLDALNHLRSGNGRSAAAALVGSGVRFERNLDPHFDGTVVMGRNAEVDNYNKLRYWKLKGKEQRYPSVRWGKESGGWKNIPDVLVLKPTAYVMILANDTARDPITHAPMFRWVNGDCGTVTDVGVGCVTITLVRTGAEITLGNICRQTTQKVVPDELLERHPDLSEKEIRAKYTMHSGVAEEDEEGNVITMSTHRDGQPIWDVDKGRWIVGAVTYVPLRLAYATTVHKSQGLTLDRIMVDLRHSFLGSPAMTYVACSRCRTADGLHVVGDPQLVERRCKTDPLVARWL
jgi:ATP-dependent DNA helicase PIF1